ncbi:hypothetical protein DICPUDRAFT_85503, partial [Dictyostelium purpureum]
CQVLIYKEDDDQSPIWELQLKKKPSNIYFINLPLIFDPVINKSQQEEKEEEENNKLNWSQGCLVVNYQKEDELVQVYSIATKVLLNEITKVQEIWIHDFLSYGFDQLLIRHHPPAPKVITLSMIPLQYILNFNRINLKTIIDQQQKQDANNYKKEEEEKKVKKSVPFKIIMDSLENMSTIANSEYKILEQQLKSKESLLNYSLNVLESIGVPNSIININNNKLNDWNYNLVSIFNNSSNNNDSSYNNSSNNNDNNSSGNNDLKPNLLSKLITIRDGMLYCQLEFKKSSKPYSILSVFLSSKEISLFTKLRNTITNNNNSFGILVSNSTPSTTILLETSLKDINLNFYSPNLINIILEWSYSNSVENNDLCYNSNNIYSSFLDSFYLNDFLNKNSNNSNNNRALDNYPYSLEFNIVGDDLIKLLNNFETIFPKNQFRIQNLDFYDIDFGFNNNNSNNNIIVQSIDNSCGLVFIEFKFELKSENLLSFKINSICFFNLLNNLKLLIDNLPNGCNLNLSNENEWNSKLKIDICDQIKKVFDIIIQNEDNLSNNIAFNKKEQKNTFIKFHNVYQKVFQSLIETQSLLYNLEVLNKFNN